MTAFSNYSEDKIAKWLAGQESMPAHGNRYLALYSSNPTDANSGTEVTTTIREAGRLQITFGTPVDGLIRNNADINFGAAAGSATVAYIGILDAASAGNLLAYGPLSSPKSVSAPDELIFEANSISITIA